MIALGIGVVRSQLSTTVAPFLMKNEDRSRWPHPAFSTRPWRYLVTG